MQEGIEYKKKYEQAEDERDEVNTRLDVFEKLK